VRDLLAHEGVDIDQHRASSSSVEKKTIVKSKR
jgi:hypothetical protein